MSKKLPAFQFYPGDWLKDPSLRLCSIFARGLLVDLLCMMFEAENRGVLQKRNGAPWGPKDVHRAIGSGSSLQEIEEALQELEENGVLKREESSGCLYSARMVRDEEIRQTRKQAGSKGGSKTQAKRKQTGKQKSTPSSSSSSSSSDKSSKGKSDAEERPTLEQELKSRLAALSFPHEQVHTPKVVGFIRTWAEEGLKPDDLELIVTALRERSPSKAFGPAYLERPVADYLEAKKNGTKGSEGAFHNTGSSKQAGHDIANQILEQDISKNLSDLDDYVCENNEEDIQGEVDVEVG